MKNRTRLENKVIVITGATRGIGLSIAEACGRQGGKIVICSRHEAAVSEAVDTLKKKGIKISGITADVSKGADLEKLIQHSLDKWGKLDVWINNAGLSSGMRTIHEFTPGNDTSYPLTYNEPEPGHSWSLAGSLCNPFYQTFQVGIKNFSRSQLAARDSKY